MTWDLSGNLRKFASVGTILGASITTVMPFNTAVADNWDDTLEHMRETALNSPSILAPRYSRANSPIPSIAIFIGKNSEKNPDAWENYVEGIFKHYGYTVKAFAIKDGDYNGTIINPYVNGVIVGIYDSSREGITNLMKDTIEQSKIAASAALKEAKIDETGAPKSKEKPDA